MSTPVVEEIDDYEEEQFFNEDSYDKFIKKNNLPMLDKKTYTDNDVHKINIEVPKNKRRTSEIMSHYEYVRVISERAKQIENGSVIFITTTESDPIKIAELEIKQKKSPMKIIRYIHKNIVEHWEVNEMVIPFI